MAALHGVKAGRMAATIFAMGLGLAGFAGGLMAPLFGISITMGQTGFVVLLVIMLGGIGSMLGSICAGIILGLILSFSQFFLSAGVGQMVFFAIVALFFFFRPGGLFGKPMDDPPGEVRSLTRIRRRLEGRSKWAAILVALAIALLLPVFIHDPYYVHLLILTLTYAVLGMTVTLGMRAGMINVASAAFWGIGAYSTALLTSKIGMSFWLALPTTLAISLALSLLLGTVVCRYAGALGMMFSIVFASLIPVIFQTFKVFGQSSRDQLRTGGEQHRLHPLRLRRFLLLPSACLFSGRRARHARLHHGVDGARMARPGKQPQAGAVCGARIPSPTGSSTSWSCR